MKPLAERMRPRVLDDIIGQQHLTGENGVIRNAIKNNKLPSIIFWGPPGTGKTTMAHIIAHALQTPFFSLSAISSGVKEVREVIETAKKLPAAILFIDEIHRFSKSQQDALLAAVENGTIILIGATTENPSFEVNSALLSRAQVYILKALQKTDLEELLEKAVLEDSYLQSRKVSFTEKEALLNIAGGDARKLLNLLELVVNAQPAGAGVVITNTMVMQAAQQKTALYDKKGEQHYDIISAFIKSIRGSDPNGALYWLARMIEGGEDVKFIARRLLILASEDIGNANPTALILANNCFDAVNKIGWPESNLILSQCTIYLAASPKSNSATTAIAQAASLVKKWGDLPVPLHLRNAPTTLMKKLDYGKNYRYSHDYENNFVLQEFLPDEIKGTTIYQAGNNTRENELKNYLKKLWKDKYNF